MSDDIHELLKQHTEQDAENFKRIDAKLDEIHGTLSRYKGFIGGVVFTVSALATAIALAVSYFGLHFHR